MSPHSLLARTALLLVGLVPWAGAAPLRVLILTGANNHDWRATTPILRATLEAGGLCQVVVTENPADLRPGDLGGFSIVLGNYNTFAQKAAAENRSRLRWPPLSARAEASRCCSGTTQPP